MSKERIVFITGLILSAALIRILPHAYNFTPVAAIALFAGANIKDKWLAFFVPLAAMLLSDLVLGFHIGMIAVYIAFMATVGIGRLLRGHISMITVPAASLASSVLFFLITNFAALPIHNLYPHTAEGLAESYIAALPFFGNTVLGDLFFTVLLFGAMYLAERKVPALRESAA